MADYLAPSSRPKPRSHTALRVPASPPVADPPAAPSSSSSALTTERQRLTVNPPSYVASMVASKAAGGNAPPPSSSTSNAATAASSASCDGHGSASHCAAIEKMQQQIEALTREKSQLAMHLSLGARNEATLSKQLAAVVEERNRLQHESLSRAEVIRSLDLEARTHAVAKAMATRDLEVVLQRLGNLVDDVEEHGSVSTSVTSSAPQPRQRDDSERIAAFTTLNSKLHDALNRALHTSWECGFRSGLTIGEESARRQRLQELEILEWQQLCDDYVVSHNEAMLEASFDLVDDEDAL